MAVAFDVNHDLQQVGALSVQEVIEPLPLNQLGKNPRDQPIGVDTLK